MMRSSPLALLMLRCVVVLYHEGALAIPIPPTTSTSMQPSSQLNSNPLLSPSCQPSISVQPSSSSQPSSYPSSFSFLRQSNSLANRKSPSSIGFSLTMSFIGILILFIGLQVFRKSLAGNQNSRDEMQNDTLDDIDNVIAEKLNRMDSILSMQADRNTSDVHMRPRRTPAKDKRLKHDQKDALENIDIDKITTASLVEFFENPFCQFNCPSFIKARMDGASSSASGTLLTADKLQGWECDDQEGLPRKKKQKESSQ